MILSFLKVHFATSFAVFKYKYKNLVQLNSPCPLRYAPIFGRVIPRYHLLRLRHLVRHLVRHVVRHSHRQYRSFQLLLHTTSLQVAWFDECLFEVRA